MGFNIDDTRKKKFAVQLNRFFQVDSVTVSPAAGASLFTNITQIVSATDYTWEVGGVNVEVRDSVTMSSAFDTFAIPKESGLGLVRPTIKITTNVIANENITEALVSVQFDNFLATYWKGSFLVMEYNLTKVDAQGSRFPPDFAGIDSNPTPALHAIKPISGATTNVGSELKQMARLRSDGFNISISDNAFSGAGNAKNVKQLLRTKVNPGNGTMMYLVFDKFDNTLIHTMYLNLNEWSIPASAFLTSPSSIMFMSSTAACVMAMFML
jgi:hypothetical protein